MSRCGPQTMGLQPSGIETFFFCMSHGNRERGFLHWLQPDPLHFSPTLFVFVLLCESQYITEAVLELLLLLPQSLECWDYKYTPPHPIYSFHFLVHDLRSPDISSNQKKQKPKQKAMEIFFHDTNTILDFFFFPTEIKVCLVLSWHGATHI